MIPTLHAEGITLSPFTLGDALLVQRYAGDPEVARTTLHVPHPYPDGAAEKWIASHLLQYLERTNAVFAIRSHTGELYGAINLRLHRNDHSGELGYWIGVPFWNKGICTDAARRLIQFGFDELCLNRIYARHLGGNSGSGRVMEKIGMKKEGVQRQHTLKNGEFSDIVEYGVLKSEYIEAGKSIGTENARIAPPADQGNTLSDAAKPKIRKAAFIAFPASDFEASLVFYRDLLHLPIVASGTDAFSRFAHFDCGGFGIHLYEWTKLCIRAHTGLQLYVADVDTLHQELTSRGVEFNGDVRDEPWGGRVVTVRDPDGNLFDLLNADYEQKLSG